MTFEATMDGLRNHWLKILHPRRLDPSIGAIAGLVTAVSVIVGYFAQSAIGHGWHRAFIALHVVKRPLIVRLAPFLTGAAIAIATAAALLRFYNWFRESEWRQSVGDDDTRSILREPRGRGINDSSSER